MENKRKFLLITGASSGIGRQIAIDLSSNYNIILNGRNNDKLKDTKEKCSKTNEHLIFPYDLSSIEKLEEDLSSFIQNNNIEISHFVHSAGFMKMVPLKMLSIETINTTLNTNVISATLILKVLINRKINNSVIQGVVFISSNISNFGAKAMSAYAASKSALDSLMRCLAIELAPKVRVNSVLPGGVRTEMTESMYENKELIERMASTYPLGLGTVENISDIVEFLLSDKASWITGQQFTVDGGRTINISG